MKNKIQTAIYMVLVLFSISCKKDNNKVEDLPLISTSGVFIVNEGAFGSGNSSVSYLNFATNTMYNHIFENTNNYPLGDLAQSMHIHQNKAYLIVNNSQKIEVVDAATFTSQATITGFSGPRYMVAKSGKAYVSDWFADEIKIVDLNSNMITGTIGTGSGPEQMLLAGNFLFVANVGGWGSDSTVTVINTNTESVIATIQVGINPNSIRMDANGSIWVLCGGSTGPDYIGGTADDISGSLWRINPVNYNVEQQFQMNSFDHPSKLQISGNGSELFYLNGMDGYNGKIMKMNITSSSLPTIPGTSKEFYGIGIDPVSGAVLGGYAPGFSQNGYVYRFTPAFTQIDSMEVGIAPNYFVFQ